MESIRRRVRPALLLHMGLLLPMVWATSMPAQMQASRGLGAPGVLTGAAPGLSSGPGRRLEGVKPPQERGHILLGSLEQKRGRGLKLRQIASNKTAKAAKVDAALRVIPLPPGERIKAEDPARRQGGPDPKGGAPKPGQSVPEEELDPELLMMLESGLSPNFVFGGMMSQRMAGTPSAAVLPPPRTDCGGRK